MKRLEMLAFAVAASAALIAFVGAGTASAGILCKSYTEPCNSILKNGEALSSQIGAKKKARIGAKKAGKGSFQKSRSKSCPSANAATAK